MPSKKTKKTKKTPRRAGKAIRRPNQINFNLTDEEAAAVDSAISAAAHRAGIPVSRGAYGKAAMLGAAKARELRYLVERVAGEIADVVQEDEQASSLWARINRTRVLLIEALACTDEAS